MAFVTPIIKKAEKYVKAFLRENLERSICYHNATHTKEVVKASEVIGKACGLNNEELEMVILSAWFHDTGYYKGKEDHESVSADIAEEFLKNEGFPPEKVRQVKACIIATKIPQSPKNLLEEVLCDADLYHLATDKFFEKSELLKNELCAIFPGFDSNNWMNVSCQFVQHHKYFTSFARKKLRPIKEANLRSLKTKINDSKN
ncbi:MAG TPA: hypothetical protein DDY13_08540 [Cytophagales bacterium]|jgi:predicted metal-dependent HD superfamily phosphohydrolase|nr:hypothetical protein [Cytophagales bacterium]